MGLVQYSAKFMPDVASIAKPIQELTRKGVTFKWGEEQQTAFEELKGLITQAETLGYFKVDCRTRIVADASPVGLGAVDDELMMNFNNYSYTGFSATIYNGETDETIYY